MGSQTERPRSASGGRLSEIVRQVEARLASAQVRPLLPGEQSVAAVSPRFAALVAATARPHVPKRVPDRLLQMGALSLVGAIERVMIEWHAARGAGPLSAPSIDR